MLWIVKKEVSHQIMSCNIHEGEDIEGNPSFELWVTRPNGKNLKVETNPSKSFIEEIKEAIDFAVEKGETALRLA